jgi:hypothetical protein
MADKTEDLNYIASIKFENGSWLFSVISDRTFSAMRITISDDARICPITKILYIGKYKELDICLSFADTNKVILVIDGVEAVNFMMIEEVYQSIYSTLINQVANTKVDLIRDTPVSYHITRKFESYVVYDKIRTYLTTIRLSGPISTNFEIMSIVFPSGGHHVMTRSKSFKKLIHQFNPEAQSIKMNISSLFVFEHEFNREHENVFNDQRFLKEYDIHVGANGVSTKSTN